MRFLNSWSKAKDIELVTKVDALQCALAVGATIADMHIRKVKADEWSNLQVLNNEVFVDNAKYDSDLIEEWALSEAGKTYFQELVTDTQSVCFVAEDELGKLIGYLAASPKPISYRKSKYLEIDNMGGHSTV